VKRIWLASLALVCVGILSSCSDQSCENISHDKLYEITLTKPLKASEFDPSTGQITGTRTLVVGDVIKAYGKNGIAVGSQFRLKTGSFAVYEDVSGTKSLICNTCGDGTVANDQQQIAFNVCGMSSMGCPEFRVVARDNGSIFDPNTMMHYSIVPGDTLIVCWPGALAPPPTGFVWALPFNPSPSTPTPPWLSGMPIQIVRVDKPNDAGILETPMMVTW